MPPLTPETDDDAAEQPALIADHQHAEFFRIGSTVTRDKKTGETTETGGRLVKVPRGIQHDRQAVADWYDAQVKASPAAPSRPATAAPAPAAAASPGGQ